MINRKDMEFEFSRRLGWNKIAGIPGNFSFTPDKGTSFLRVFSSDIIIRENGKQLLGVIGIHSLDPEYPFPKKLGISTYILNIDEFFDADYIQNEKDLNLWSDKISNAVLSLPVSPEDILADMRRGRLGKFDIGVFIESTPWHADFFDWVAQIAQDRSGYGPLI